MSVAPHELVNLSHIHWPVNHTTLNNQKEYIYAATYRKVSGVIPINMHLTA